MFAMIADKARVVTESFRLPANVTALQAPKQQQQHQQTAKNDMTTKQQRRATAVTCKEPQSDCKHRQERQA